MSGAETVSEPDKIRVLAAQLHAGTAQLTTLVARYDAGGEWADGGFRSLAHWLSVYTGFGLHMSSEVVRVGHALEQLPRIAGAFSEGRLSFDKVRAVTRVATPEDETVWLGVALEASGSQLERICRAVRSALDVNDPRRGDDELAHRSLRRWWREDGMVEILAVLPREDGAVVMAAIDSVASDIFTERAASDQERGGPTPEHGRRSVLCADALVRICEQRVAADSPEPAVAPTRQMVVHVDASALIKRDDSGRCHIEDGSWLSPVAAQWLACDSDVVAILERDGKPLDVGRAKRVISPRMRLALQARDRGCRYPGCGVPAKRTEGHHIRHWLDLGLTELANLISLCRFHHRRHHEGAFEIRVS
ncbi:MAG TPA: DUF222 domain-containing protein, partial [Mycobacterium sp.]|nr:DUF222 domain-containing protein [Mycobacterium sp.]